MAQVQDVQLYNGQQVHSLNGNNYFLNKQYIVCIQNNGAQQIVYTHPRLIDSFCFHGPQRSVYFTEGEQLFIYSVQQNRIMSTYQVPRCAALSVSFDSQLVLCLTPYPENKLILYRVIAKDGELAQLTNIVLPTHKQIDESLEQLYDTNRDMTGRVQPPLFTPYKTAEFIPNSNQYVILLTKFTAFVCKVQIFSGYTYFNLQQITSHGDIHSYHHLTQTYLASDLLEVRRRQDELSEKNKQQHRSQSLEFYQQVQQILNQYHDKQLQNRLQKQNTREDEKEKIQYLINKKAQNAFDQLNQPVVYGRQAGEASHFRRTGLRTNLKQILEDNCYFDSIFEFCRFTGEYSVFRHDQVDYVMLAERNFGVLAFCLGPEGRERQFGDFVKLGPMFLDLDYSDDGSPAGPCVFGARRSVLERLTTEERAYSEQRVDYPGDGRVLSILAAGQLIGAALTLVLGYQDSSVKHFSVRLAEGEVDRYEQQAVRPAQSIYYYDLGPAIRLTDVQLDQHNSLYGVTQQNRLVLCQFADFLAYLPPLYSEENERISTRQPILVLPYISDCLYRVEHVIAMITAGYVHKTDGLAQHEKRYWEKTLAQLTGEPSFLSGYLLSLLQTPSGEPICADFQTFKMDDGQLVVVQGLVDGRIIIQHKGYTQFLTARCPLNLLDQCWFIPDGVMCATSIQQQKIYMTGHVSGYVRVYNFQGDGTLKMVNRIKLSNMPITQMCVSSDQKTILVTDGQHNVYFISGISESNIVMGYFNIQEVPNIMQLNKQHIYELNANYNDYVNKTLNQLIYNNSKDITGEPVRQDLVGLDYNTYQQINIVNYTISKLPKDELKPFKEVAHQLVKGGDLGENADLVKPLPIYYQNKYLKNLFNYVVAVSCSAQHFYIALSTGEILKITAPKNQRRTIANDNSNAAQNEDFYERLTVATEYELKQLEQKFYQIIQDAKINLLEETEYCIIKTGLAISAMTVDQLVVSAPYNIQDLIYVATFDGRVFVYQDKQAVKQPQNSSKFDFPIIQQPIVQLETQVTQLSIQDGILIINDLVQTVFMGCVLPELASMKKQAQSCLKNDELQVTIQSSELNLRGTVDLLQGDARAVCTELIAGQKTSKIVDGQVLTLTSSGFAFRAQLNEALASTATEQLSQVDVLSQQFMTQLLNQQSVTDVAAQNKNILKISYDNRTFYREFKLQQTELQTIQQQLLSLQVFQDGPLSVKQQIVSPVTQYFCKQITYKTLGELVNGVQSCEEEADLQKFDIKDQQQHQQKMNQDIEQRILLCAVPSHAECDYLSCGRLVTLVILNYLRYKTNLQLIEEAVKITELSKDIEKRNYIAIDEKNLCVLPVKASMVFLRNKKHALSSGGKSTPETGADNAAPADPARQPNVEKIIAASSIVSEVELRVSDRVANTTRAVLLQKAQLYERQFKAELLTAKTFLNSLQQEKVNSCLPSQIGEAVCGINDKQIYVASIPMPADQATYVRKARKMVLLRAAQLVSERMAPYMPPALIKDGEGKWTLPSEQQIQQQNAQVINEFYQTQFSEYKQVVDVEQISDKYEPPASCTTVDDPFAIMKSENFTSQTLLSALSLGARPADRAMLLPYFKNYVLQNASGETEEEKALTKEQTIHLITNMPSISMFYKIPTPSLRRCCFLECETVFQVRAIQQMYILKAITILLIADINQRVNKVKEEKFKTVQQINDKVTQIIDIGKELMYHTREEIMTQMIEQQRKNLFAEYQNNGVAVEECAERAAKNAPAIVNGREREIDELAMKKLEQTGVLDLNSIVGFTGLKQTNKVESLQQSLKLDSDSQNSLHKIAQQSSIDKFAQQLQLFQNEIKANGNVSQNTKEALSALTDQGLFRLSDIDVQIQQLTEQLSKSNVQVSQDTLMTAESYKRAIYEMMRGSIDASNKESIRDVIIPPVYGLNHAKLQKDQLQAIEKYETFLQTIAETRAKETRLLNTQSQTLREQIEQICVQFDGTTLKQLRERVFNGIIKINALELNQTIIVLRKLRQQRQKELLQMKQVYQVEFEALKEQVDQNVKYLQEEVIVKYQNSMTQIAESLTYFNQQVEKYPLLPDQQLRDLLKKPVRVNQLIQQIRQFLNTENRLKVKQTLQQSNGNTEQCKIIEEFFLNYQNYLLEDGQNAFKQCQANYAKYISTFFEVLNPIGTLQATSYSALSNDPIFPDAITCKDVLVRQLLTTFQILYHTPYFAIFSKIVPIEGEVKCTNQQQLRVYDALRAFKSVASIVQAQQKDKLEQAEKLAEQLGHLKSLMLECQTFNTEIDLDKIKEAFCNQYILTLFKEGQIEYLRNFEAINDMQKIRYQVDQDGNVLQTTETNRPRVHDDDNIIMRDDSQFVIVDKGYLERNINEDLITKYNQLKDKLNELSKVHSRIRKLQSECEIMSQRTANCLNETKDFQMIRVSKDMLEIIRNNTSNESRKAQELKIMQNKLQHSKKAHDVLLRDREQQLSRIPLDIQRLSVQNNQLLQQIEEVEAKNQQREQAIPDFIDEDEKANLEEDEALFMDLEQKYSRLKQLKNPAQKRIQEVQQQNAEETDKKFRRIAALRKMRELRTAQEEEMKFLLTELDRLRKKTYIQFE